MNTPNFRAWDGERMLSAETGHGFLFRGDAWRVIENKIEGASVPFKAKMIMRNTDLKDRGGKDIFELDRLCHGTLTHREACDIFVVKFGEYDNDESWEDNIAGYGWYADFGGLRVMALNNVAEYSTVIGNIFEPENNLDSPTGKGQNTQP